MIEFLALHQLNIMLILGSICGMTAFFSLVSRSVSFRRKASMIGMELSAMVLLFADRYAYIYRSQADPFGFFMTRISNFLVFSMIIAVLFSVNQYIKDICIHDVGLNQVPKLLYVNDELSLVGELLIIISQFTGLYYTFDETNHYVRSPGFVISYCVPILIAAIQLMVVSRLYHRLRKKIIIPLLIFTILPIAASIIQYFVYGISIINISLVGMVVIIYICVLIDMNETLDRAHKLEMEILNEEKMSMKRMFDQTATAFVAAIEKKDPFLQGHASRVADIARRIGSLSGKNEEECEKIYYAALLHDIGMVGLPDSLIGKTDDLTEEEYETVKKKPLMSWEILSSITEYPYLSQSARYSYERFDGKGYPEGLSGDLIPEISRIISVANSYDAMVTKKRFRGPLPMQIVREELLNESGGQFDPEFAGIMIQIIDSDSKEILDGTETAIQKEIECRKYRDQFTIGVPILNNICKVRFKCKAWAQETGPAIPSIILFESFDRHVHGNAKSIEAYNYSEYGELWFDGHIISTGARNTEVKVTENTFVYSRTHKEDNVVYDDKENKALVKKEDHEQYFEIVMGRYEDHIKLQLLSAKKTVDAVIALPNKSKAAFLALTGENCRIYDIETEQTEKAVQKGEIPRIAEEISYIERLTSDIPNVQVDRDRTASTEAIEIKDWTQLKFHSMTLPSASLVWDCPYIVIFSSDDRKVSGKGYHEYALVKLNGENENTPEFAENKFAMKKTEAFTSWEDWKRLNKDGVEYEVVFLRKGNRIIMNSENLGILIENTTKVQDGAKKVYAAITGSQVAITDIRIQ